MEVIMIGFTIFSRQMMNFSVNIFHEFRSIFVKVGMRINVLIGVFFIRDLFKIVYVQLTNKGGQVWMLKVFGKNFLRKSGRILYLKWVLFGTPTNILRGLILQLRKLLHLASVVTLREMLKSYFAFFLLFYSLTNLLYYITPWSFPFHKVFQCSRIFLKRNRISQTKSIW